MKMETLYIQTADSRLPPNMSLEPTLIECFIAAGLVLHRVFDCWFRRFTRGQLSSQPLCPTEVEAPQCEGECKWIAWLLFVA